MADEPGSPLPQEGQIPIAQPSIDMIGLTAGSETVAVYQLAARWAERYASEHDDLAGMLDRFRRAYLYLDAVTSGMEPPKS